MTTSCGEGKARLLHSLFFILITTALGFSGGPASGEDLPVRVPNLPMLSAGIRSGLTFDQLRVTFEPASYGLSINLGDPGLQGKIYVGQYPFAAGEADYDYPRYRLSGRLSNGKATLPLGDLIKGIYDVNNWRDAPSRATPTVAYRLDLWRLKDGNPVPLGYYDGLVAFRHEGDKFFKNLSIVEGPFVNQVNSDNPGTLLISWRTDAPSSGKVLVYPIGGAKERLRVGNNDGVLDSYSPNPDFLHPTWHITVGTAGAPYYVREKKTPWAPEVFFSEEGYAIFHAEDEAVSLKFVTVTGQILDEIPDLMAVKRESGK